MDETMRAHAAELRRMPSETAADWLIQHDPSGDIAITLLKHVSLRRGDYQRLAKHYLAGPTHADGRAYHLFAERLGLAGLIRILSEQKVRDCRDADLLAYHLGPILRDAKNVEESQEAAAFVESLASL